MLKGQRQTDLTKPSPQEPLQRACKTHPDAIVLLPET